MESPDRGRMQRKGGLDLCHGVITSCYMPQKADACGVAQPTPRRWEAGNDPKSHAPCAGRADAAPGEAAMKLALSQQPPQASVRRLIRQFGGAACASHPQARARLAPADRSQQHEPLLLLTCNPLSLHAYLLHMREMRGALAGCSGSSQDAMQGLHFVLLNCKIQCAGRRAGGALG